MKTQIPRIYIELKSFFLQPFIDRKVLNFTRAQSPQRYMKMFFWAFYLIPALKKLFTNYITLYYITNYIHTLFKNFYKLWCCWRLESYKIAPKSIYDIFNSYSSHIYSEWHFKQGAAHKHELQEKREHMHVAIYRHHLSRGILSLSYTWTNF